MNVKLLYDAIKVYVDEARVAGLQLSNNSKIQLAKNLVQLFKGLAAGGYVVQQWSEAQPCQAPLHLTNEEATAWAQGYNAAMGTDPRETTT